MGSGERHVLVHVRKQSFLSRLDGVPHRHLQYSTIMKPLHSYMTFEVLVTSLHFAAM